MNHLLEKTIKDFYSLDDAEPKEALELLLKIKQYVIPILRCRYVENEAIELENKLFKYLDPENFFRYALPDKKKIYYHLLLRNIIHRLKYTFIVYGLKFQYLQRIKSAYSSMNRVFDKKIFVLDKFGVRIIFDSDFENFYQRAWWIVINLRKKFKIVHVKDYMATPRKTGYSALHVSIDYDDVFVEIQIVYLQDAKVKLPHFCYKQDMSQNNLYINKHAHSAKEKILQDFKNYIKCRSGRK